MHRNTRLQTLVLASALAALVATVAAPVEAVAADLSLQPAERVAVHVKHRHRVVHHASRAVRDYDGTPVVFRPYRTVPVVALDGTVVSRIEYVAISAPRSSPRTYLNGEPVLPQHPRGWPRTATLRYRMMAGLP
jgi:hypothetical protein